MKSGVTKGESVYTLLVLYDLHTRLFNNVIDGIGDNDAHNRFQTRANHMAWIAGSLIYERYDLASAVGVDTQSLYPSATGILFSERQGIIDDVVYPSMTAYSKDWNMISPVLRLAMTRLSESELSDPDLFGMPDEDLTLFNALCFIIDRESYCIGQLGLYRRLLGYEPMKYI
jgi:hypothetical protein